MEAVDQESAVIIVGAGPSGLATAACLAQLSIPYIILEREDCFASLWKKKTYDRLQLHLAKQFCELPHMPFPANFPTFVPKKEFLQYLDDYVSHFNTNPLYFKSVEGADYDEGKWNLKIKNLINDEVEEFRAKFLVVASGETSDTFIPEVDGLSSFKGEVIHSTQYQSGKNFRDKNVLVVGSGNSGMEIAFDLSNHGAKTSIVVRSPTHVLSRGMAYLGLISLKHFRLELVDSVLVFLSKLIYGDLSKHGIERPEEGPFALKVKYGKYPVIDTGTIKKIKSGEIQVLTGVTNMKGGNEVVTKDGKSNPFDTIVFATGFKRSTNKWLKGDEYLLNEDGLPKPVFPNHWKGKNGLYCAGLARRGLYGAAMDAQNIANDIKSTLHIFATMSFIAETFIFIYVGMDALDMEKWTLSNSPGKTVGASTILLSLVLVGRAMSVFPISFLSNFGRRNVNEKINFKQMVIIWWAGLMRGAVSMALAYNKFTQIGHTQQPSNAIMVTSTITVVLFSTVVFGLLNKPLLRLLTHKDNPTMVDSKQATNGSLGQPLLVDGHGSEDHIDNNFVGRRSSLRMLLTRPTYTVHYYWEMFDDSVMRPIFGGPGLAPYEDLDSPVDSVHLTTVV